MVETQSTTFKAEFDSVEEALKDFGKFYLEGYNLKLTCV
jgi:hypothetical protein